MIWKRWWHALWEHILTAKHQKIKQKGATHTQMLNHSCNSLEILDAICLKAIELPEIRLNLTPFRESLGSLHTSISHWTKLPPSPSPWVQRTRKRSFFSKEIELESRTLPISSTMVWASMVLVVLMLQVNRKDRGLSSDEGPLQRTKNGNSVEFWMERH